VLGGAEDRVGGRLLDDPPGVHHRDLVRHLGHHPEVVGDDDHGHPQLVLEPRDQIEDLRLHGDVQGRGRLVGDQHLRLVGQGHRDHGALAHAPGELVRVVVDPLARLGDPHEAEQVDGPIKRLGLGDVPVGANRLHELAPDLVEGMQGGQRVLEDHRDVVAAHPAHLLVRRVSRSRPSKTARPEMSALCERVRPMIVRLETLLPDPDSPTIPSTLPRSTE
jgi:hypothetical protein